VIGIFLRPHITIASYNAELNIEEFMSRFEGFYELKTKLQIKLSILGTFLKTGALFLTPVPSQEFMKLHNDHHIFFEKYRSNADSLYLPDNWIPHCTIANRLKEENLKEALVYCTNRIEIMNVHIVEISIIKAIYENYICISSPTIYNFPLK
jgi:hypothetical protein